jgi:hypothetical protein
MSTLPNNDLWMQALALPENERVQLAGELLASVKLPGALSFDDPDFLAVLASRQKELRSGSAKTYSAEETVAAMKDAVAKQRRR